MCDDHDHGHDHDHDHGHGHDHGERFAPLGAVPFLDIGGDIGAILVTMSPETAATLRRGELFACPPGRPDEHFHTGMHHRGDHVVALFAEVVEGDYDLLDDDRRPLQRVTVVGGSVTELELTGDHVAAVAVTA